MGRGAGALAASPPRNAGFSHVENANALFQPRPPGGAEAPGRIVTAAFACERPLVPIPTPTPPLPQHGWAEDFWDCWKDRLQMSSTIP